MKLSMCHYSFHALIQAERWDLARFVRECRALGLPACDFHQRLVGTLDEATAGAIRGALRDQGMQVSAFSLGNNFCKSDPAEHRQQVAEAVAGMEFAARIGARIVRFFGCEDPQVWIDAMQTCLPVAEKYDLVIALENHGGRSSACAAQLQDIRAIDSPCVRALIDIGNYMQAGDDPVASIRQMLPFCVYVHLKDNKWFPQGSAEGRFYPRAGCNLKGEILGRGDVDLAGCLRALREGGYRGFAALEYEGTEEPRQGIAASLANVRAALAAAPSG